MSGSHESTVVRARLDRLLESTWYRGGWLSLVLVPLALVVGALVGLRRRAYARGWLDVVDVGVPVVVVGNLSVGGTGKTPVLVTLAEALGQRGLRVGIVTRGYGGRSASWPQRVLPDSDPGEVGDEPVLLARRTGLAVVAGPDRVAAARRLLAEIDADIVLSDDGLQHYRLERAYEICVVDGQRGLGNGRLLPAGPLREPAARLAEVDAVIVNGPGFDAPRARHARAVATRVFELTTGAEARLADFAGHEVRALAGIGNPARFFGLLRDAGIIVHGHSLPDHVRFDASMLELGDGLPVLVTEKDAVKLARVERSDVWCVVIDLEIEGLTSLVDALLAKTRERNRPAR